MSLVTSKRYYKVAVLLFEGVNILDFAGPIETLSHVSHNRDSGGFDQVFDINIIARTPKVSTKNSVTIQPDVLLSQAVHNIASYNILIVPGGPPSIITRLITSGCPEVDLVRSFANLVPRVDGNPRTLFSICTGTLFLGAAGVLSGVSVTTHHLALDLLRDICTQANEDGTSCPEIVHRRYIDGGPLKNSSGSVRLLTAGGVTSGLDATLYLVGHLISPDMAAHAANMMEYDWVQDVEMPNRE